jgi:uncharacterized protein (DUF4415 family)
MSANNIIKKSAEQLTPGDSDWARVDALTDRDIDRAISDDSDAAPALDEEWFKTAVVMVPVKSVTSMRIDSDVMDWFKGQGRGWQTRMNSVLRAYARAHGGVK